MSAAATVAVAVATVCLVVARLSVAVAVAGDPPPPGVSADDVADQVAEGTAALSSAVPALGVLVAILAATAVAQLARLVAAAREHESATLRARGLSAAQAWVTDAVEALIVALVGVALGLAAAAALTPFVGAGAADAIAAWPWALAMSVVLAIVFTLALRRGERTRAAARVTRATTGAAIVSLVLASALVVWQLPLARGAGFDPIVAVAPAVVLMTGASVALAVFAAAAIAWARPAASLPAVQPGYGARQVARRIPVYAVAVMLASLTVAQAVYASAYSATWTSMVADSAAVRAGADLRVDVSPQTAGPDDVAAAAAVAGVVSAAPAYIGAIEIGDADAQLVAVPTSEIEGVVSTAGGLIDTATLAAATRGEEAAFSDPLPLGAEARALRMTLGVRSADGDPPTLAFSAVVLDARGTPAALRFDGDARHNPDGSVTVVAEAALPEAGAAPWRLLAIGADRVRSPQNSAATLTLDSVAAVGGEPLKISAEAELSRGFESTLVWLADGGVLADAGADTVAPPLAGAVSRELADRLGVEEGGSFDFRYAGTGRRGSVVVTSIVDAVPGASTPLALFASMEHLLVSQLQRGASFVPPNAVWAAGDPRADDGLSAALGDRPVTVAAPGVAAALVGALVPGWWIATAGAGVLSLVAAFAIVQTLAIARRRELGVLRALGLTPAVQARMRAAELGGVFAAALALGVPTGLLAAWLTVPSLVRAVTPGILPLAGGVSVSWGEAAVAVALLAAGLTVIVAAAAWGVARSARTQTVGEEAR